jgi:ribosomal-protein-alanine N-acetyltransferase
MNINLIPFPDLTTDRLLLRRLNINDAGQIQKLRSDDRVNQYIPRSGSVTIQESENFIRSINESLDNNTSVYWVIALKTDNLLIGTICFWNLSPEKDMAETGYELMPAYHGKGLMQEAITAVIAYGFDIMKLKVITAFPSPENESSVKLLQRNNFREDLDYEYVSKEEAGEQAVYVSLSNQAK